MKKLSSGHSVLFTILLVAATGCKKDSDGTSSSAKPNPTVLAAPKSDDVDPKVTEKVSAVKVCKRDEGTMSSENCPPLKELSDFEDAYVQNDEGDAKRKRLVLSCIASLADANDNIREAAARCVGDSTDDLVLDEATKRFVLQRCGMEKAKVVQLTFASALQAMHPADSGMEPEALAIVKQMRDDEVAARVLGEALEALVPRSGDLSSGAVDLGLSLLTSPNLEYREHGAELLQHSKARAKDACKGLASLAATGKFPWASAVGSMAALGLACQDDLDPVVGVVVQKMGEPDAYDKGFAGADIVYLERALDAHLFSAAQRAKMRAAAEERAKTVKKDDLVKLISELK